MLVAKILKSGNIGGPLQAITDSIPLEVKQASLHFLHWPIEHIQLAEHHPQAYVQLCEQNPALINYLASLSANHTLWNASYWGQLLGKNQKDITLEIGAGSDLAGYLAKIRDIGLCCHGYLELALSARRQPHMKRLLNHIQEINLDVILAAFQHWQIVGECPNLLHLAAEGAAMSTDVSDSIEVISSTRQRMRKPRWPWRKIRSTSALQRLEKQTVDEAVGSGLDDAILYALGRNAIKRRLGQRPMHFCNTLRRTILRSKMRIR